MDMTCHQPALMLPDCRLTHGSRKGYRHHRVPAITSSSLPIKVHRTLPHQRLAGYQMHHLFEPTHRLDSAPSSQVPHSPNLPPNHLASSVVVAPHQANTSDFSAHRQPRPYAGAFQMDLSAVDQPNRNLAQERRVQTQWQQQAQQVLLIRQQQRQWASTQIEQQQHDQQAQGHTLARQHQLQRQPNILPAQHMLQLQQEQAASPMGNGTSPLRLTAQQTPGQPNGSQNVAFASLLATHPHLQKAVATGFVSTAQQFTPKPRRPVVPQFPTKITSQPSPQVVSAQSFAPPRPVGPISNTPQPRIDANAAARAEREQHNQRVEHLRLERERRKGKEQLTRKIEALQDPNAIYHSYREVLKYFPLRHGDTPNPYLTGLLANQLVFDEPTTDRALAIRYAKEHWENYWELKDLGFVAKLAKEADEKKRAERWQRNAASMKYRR